MTKQQQVRQYFHEDHVLKIAKVERLAGIKFNRLNYFLQYDKPLTDDEADKALKVLKRVVKAVTN